MFSNEGPVYALKLLRNRIKMITEKLQFKTNISPINFQPNCQDGVCVIYRYPQNHYCDNKHAFLCIENREKSV